ncbi:hypothetical protein FC83_GL002723 [Agrilactobacillus composti DSM 18527 = JCM 14202]|uniref:Surface layer protein A domain-containing protein n=2 Tax=Agrilactobacillus TaxID=2767875 RepID=A0A0R1Y6T8_9LACO|nr:hypothetical protein FC83_GL002723 [Agrilactobacillus composti DSM 18527 = JCM 14202]
MAIVFAPTTIAQGTEFLAPQLDVGYQEYSKDAGPGPFKEANTYYDYPTVATVNGEWGANVFYGNDDSKVFDRILPIGSQWQVYGYTLRKDGWYYDVGGDMWLQANQAKVPVSDNYDALLNAEAFIGSIGAHDDYRVLLVRDEYGVHYKVGRFIYGYVSGSAIFEDAYLYNVYADGQVYSMGPISRY